MKIRSEGAKLFHADGQTDVMKLEVRFHNFANVPKNVAPVCTMKANRECKVMTPLIFKLSTG
jgi:hypothetical protein